MHLLQVQLVSGPWVTRNEPLRRTVGPQSPLALAPDVAYVPALMELSLLPSAAQPMRPGRSRILNPQTVSSVNIF